MTAVIYNTNTGFIIAEYATMAAAKAAYTKASAAKMLKKTISLKGRRYFDGKLPPMAVMDFKRWDVEINVEYVGSKGHTVKLGTPHCCDPNSDHYWSM